MVSDRRRDFGGEPPLMELMADPVLQTMVASSGLDRGQFLELITEARSRLLRPKPTTARCLEQASARHA